MNIQEIAMPRIHFQQQLVALKDKLLAMAALSQQALEFSVEAYLGRDVGLSNHVQEIEAAINQYRDAHNRAGSAAGYLAAGRYPDDGAEGRHHDSSRDPGAARG
jgi:hypothetical protein